MSHTIHQRASKDLTVAKRLKESFDKDEKKIANAMMKRNNNNQLKIPILKRSNSTAVTSPSATSNSNDANDFDATSVNNDKEEDVDESKYYETMDVDAPINDTINDTTKIGNDNTNEGEKNISLEDGTLAEDIVDNADEEEDPPAELYITPPSLCLVSLSDLAVGSSVIITARIWPGINKPGGHAIITAIDASTGRIDVRYVLCGREKKVELIYVRPFVEIERGCRVRVPRTEVYLPVAHRDKEDMSDTNDDGSDDDEHDCDTSHDEEQDCDTSYVEEQVCDTNDMEVDDDNTVRVECTFRYYTWIYKC